MLPGEFDHTNSKNVRAAQQIPSRAVLARRFPKLRLNCYTRAWCDDASGARGYTIESLLAFLREGGR